MTYGANGATREQELAKDYNDVYVELLFGANYYLFKLSLPRAQSGLS